MCQVVNKYKTVMSDPDVVYIGRGSVWGNPFRMSSEKDREGVIRLYREHLWAQIKRGAITKEMLIALDGKRLACYCAPKSCHGDVIVKAVNWALGS
jgi:hypothetical protein